MTVSSFCIIVTFIDSIDTVPFYLQLKENYNFEKGGVLSFEIYRVSRNKILLQYFLIVFYQNYLIMKHSINSILTIFLLISLLAVQKISVQNLTTPFSCGMEESGIAPETNTVPAPNAQLPICTDPNTIKYVRVAVHFFLSEQEFIERTFEDDCVSGASVTRIYFGPGNFTEYGDGNGSVSYNGFNRAEDIVANANAELANNATQGA